MGHVQRHRVVTLDALRGVGALLVLVSHVGFWSGASRDGVLGALAARGDSGVAVFFAISAYLLGRPAVARALADDPPPARVARYARHRAVRILPAYLLVLAAVVLAALVIGGRADDPVSVRTVLVHLVVGQGLVGPTFQSFTQTWSLTTEVCFYLLLPLAAGALGILLRRLPGAARGRAVLCGVLVLALVGLAVQALAASAPGAGWSGPLATSVVGHAAWFAVGLVAAVVSLDGAALPARWGALRETVATSPGTLVLTAGIVLLVACTPLAGPRDLAAPSPAEAVVKELLYAVLAALLLAAALARGADERVQRSPAAGAARWAGDLSYGVFLWHVLVLQVLFATLSLPLFAVPAGWLLVAVLVISLGLAALTWVGVERPALRRLRQEPVGSPAGAAAPR